MLNFWPFKKKLTGYIYWVVNSNGDDYNTLLREIRRNPKANLLIIHKDGDLELGAFMVKPLGRAVIPDESKKVLFKNAIEQTDRLGRPEEKLSLEAMELKVEEAIKNGNN